MALPEEVVHKMKDLYFQVNENGEQAYTNVEICEKLRQIFEDTPHQKKVAKLSETAVRYHAKNKNWDKIKSEKTYEKLRERRDIIETRSNLDKNMLDVSAEIINERRRIALTNLTELDTLIKYKLQCTKLKHSKKPADMSTKEYNEKVDHAFSDAELVKLRKQEGDFVLKVSELEINNRSNDIMQEALFQDQEIIEMEAEIIELNPELKRLLEK